MEGCVFFYFYFPSKNLDEKLRDFAFNSCAKYSGFYSEYTRVMALHVGARLAGQRRNLSLSPTILLDKLKVDFSISVAHTPKCKC